MIPWTSEDYAIEECRRQAAELRASGQYSRVVIRPARSEGGRSYGRVYVERKDA